VRVGFDQSTLTGATIVGEDLKDDIAVLRGSTGTPSRAEDAAAGEPVQHRAG
jgi:hypothetical protein